MVVRHLPAEFYAFGHNRRLQHLAALLFVFDLRNRYTEGLAHLGLIERIERDFARIRDRCRHAVKAVQDHGDIRVRGHAVEPGLCPIGKSADEWPAQNQAVRFVLVDHVPDHVTEVMAGSPKLLIRSWDLLRACDRWAAGFNNCETCCKSGVYRQNLCHSRFHFLALQGRHSGAWRTIDRRAAPVTIERRRTLVPGRYLWTGAARLRHFSGWSAPFGSPAHRPRSFQAQPRRGFSPPPLQLPRRAS